MRPERCVEASHAGKARGQRDLRHRESRVAQQLLRQQQPLRLMYLQGRRAQSEHEESPQMTRRDRSASGKRSH